MNEPDDTLEEKLLAEATAEGLLVPVIEDAPPGEIRTLIELITAVEAADDES